MLGKWWGWPCATIDTKVIKVLAQVLSQAPFEVVLESCPNPGLLTELMKELFNKAVDNPIHVALAESLQDGVLHHIVTTNYDCMV